MFKPDIYKKSIFDINYKELKNSGIRAIIFDLDNTVIDDHDKVFTQKTKQLFDSLKKDFEIAIVSDTLRTKKAKHIISDYPIEIVTKAIKPTKKGFKKLTRISKLESSKVCMVGDQLLTDMWGAKNMGYKAILVDCISRDIEFITGINRLIEKYLFKKYQLERGKYYE